MRGQHQQHHEQGESHGRGGDAGGCESCTTDQRSRQERFGLLKNDLGNSYLMGTNQYPNTSEKARVILGNSKPLCTQHNQPPCNNGGVAFLQQGGQGNGGRSRGGTQDRDRGTASNKQNPGTVSGAQANASGETYCLHCSEEGHWASAC